MRLDFTDNEIERLERMAANLRNSCNVEMASQKGTMLMLDLKHLFTRSASMIEEAIKQEQAEWVSDAR